MILLTIFAEATASNNRTLILIAILGSITSIVVSMINSSKLSKVAELPKSIHELKINLDGRLQELMDSKEKAAYSAGMAQERTEERGRQGEGALGLKAASPTPVIVANPTEKPVYVKPIE